MPNVKFGGGGGVWHLLPAAQSTETSTTMSVFRWYQFQRGVCLIFEV